MDLGLIGFVIVTIGGFLMLAGVLALASTEKERTGITGEASEARGPGLYLIYAGLAVIGAGFVTMLVA
ncbi:MAG: hypothetical protein KAS77_01460 [Thermoplasmata archaeon]|nr:hypothetical protein [Thermoplasmata archaeon]